MASLLLQLLVSGGHTLEYTVGQLGLTHKATIEPYPFCAGQGTHLHIVGTLHHGDIQLSQFPIAAILLIGTSQYGIGNHIDEPLQIRLHTVAQMAYPAALHPRVNVGQRVILQVTHPTHRGESSQLMEEGAVDIREDGSPTQGHVYDILALAGGIRSQEIMSQYPPLMPRVFHGDIDITPTLHHQQISGIGHGDGISLLRYVAALVPPASQGCPQHTYYRHRQE